MTAAELELPSALGEAHEVGFYYRDGRGDRLTSALAHLHELPAEDGPCDPACAFLHGLSGQAPVPDVPGIAITCSLDGAHYDGRLTRWREVLGTAPRRWIVSGEVVVRVPADRVGVLVDLVVAEQQRCPFFTFVEQAASAR